LAKYLWYSPVASFLKNPDCSAGGRIAVDLCGPLPADRNKQYTDHPYTVNYRLPIMSTLLKSKNKGCSPQKITKPRPTAAAGKPMPLQELHARPGNLIRRCHQIAVAIFLEEAATAGFDTTPVQCTALLAIREQPGMDQTRLVNLIALDRSSLGNVVAGLQTKGLIRRRSGKKDKRTKQLYLTDAGSEFLEIMVPAIDRVQKRIL
jgi:DNA-binding MarR family transcriptional regulator